MTRMQKEGKAKAEARHSKWAVKMGSRQRGKTEARGKAAWDLLQRMFAGEGDHGKATKERLLDYIAEKCERTEQAEAAVYATAKWAVQQKDPVAGVNRQLNDAEAAAETVPVVDPGVFVKKEGE